MIIYYNNNNARAVLGYSDSHNMIYFLHILRFKTSAGFEWILY